MRPFESSTPVARLFINTILLNKHDDVIDVKSESLHSLQSLLQSDLVMPTSSVTFCSGKDNGIESQSLNYNFSRFGDGIENVMQMKAS